MRLSTNSIFFFFFLAFVVAVDSWAWTGGRHPAPGEKVEEKRRVPFDELILLRCGGADETRSSSCCGGICRSYRARGGHLRCDGEEEEEEEEKGGVGLE
ncbi:unnamed protein product [Musa hybrid cultivar]